MREHPSGVAGEDVGGRWDAAGAGDGPGGRPRRVFDREGRLQGHNGPVDALAGSHDGRVRPNGGFHDVAAAGQARARRGAVRRVLGARGGVRFHVDGRGVDLPLRLKRGRGGGEVDSAVGGVRIGLFSGGRCAVGLRDGSRCRCRCRRLGRGGVRVGDAELGRVLELAGAGHDDLQSIARHVRLERGGGRPGEGAGVGNIVAQAIDGDHVFRGPTEEHDGHGPRGGGLRLPSV